jgi:hypothetical protein
MVQTDSFRLLRSQGERKLDKKHPGKITFCYRYITRFSFTYLVASVISNCQTIQDSQF